MPQDFLTDLLQRHLDAGTDPDYWWGDKPPFDSIPKRVTDLLDLRGKKAVVTGGAGLNLGQATVNRLAALGADVAVVDLKAQEAVRTGQMRWATPPNAQQVADDVAERWGTNVIAVEGDAMDWDDIQSIVAQCNDRLGGIDIVVLSATATALGEILTLSREDFDRSARGVFLGPVYWTRIVADYMIPRGGGAIVVVGSEAALTHSPGLTTYGALKAGLNTWTKFAGKELIHHGIRVNGVNPGCMWGPNRELLPDSILGLYSLGRTPLQRFQLPEEVANMIAFLASEAASCMVGTMVDMGGGMSL